MAGRAGAAGVVQEADLARRRGGAAGTTPRREADLPQIVSGLREGHTTGAPLTVCFANADTRPSDYAAFADHWRPSHADRTARVKWDGRNDPRGGGHFSGRLTAALVAAGVVAKKCLPDVRFETRLAEVGGETDPARFGRAIAAAQRDGDSVGGVVECRIAGAGTGAGDPFFDSVESVAVKPTPSIAREQLTYNAASGRMEPLAVGGRHDVCIAIRAAAAVEAALAIALAELIL